MHELADRRVIDSFGGGDERDAALAQVGHDDGVVVAVACHPGQLVDNHEPDVLVLTDAGEHLLHGDPLGHLGAGAAGLDIFVNDREAEVGRLALAGDALGWDRESFGVVIGVDLSGARNAQVDHGAG